MGSYPELEVLWVQWECCDSTAELNTLHGCVFVEGGTQTPHELQVPEGLQVPHFPGLVNTGIIMTI